MRTIGFRASPTEITYCIVETNESDTNILVIDKLIIPKSLNTPEQLKFVRNTLLDIINQNFIERAGIRITESVTQPSIERISFEAIIQEILASSFVEKYFLGQTSNISSKLGFKREDFKHYLKNDLDIEYIPNWKKFSEKEKESLLVAYAAQKL